MKSPLFYQSVVRTRLVYKRTKLSSGIEKQEQKRQCWFGCRLETAPEQKDLAANGTLDMVEYEESVSAKET
jgi:hypothetical protein